jgi:superfamily II DNA or RNA helicase
MPELRINAACDPIATRGFELVDWQREAVSRWLSGDASGPHRGTLEIFTGGGKTLIALTCAARVAEVAPALRVAVVVPTEALAHQWTEAILRFTNVRRHQVGLLGAGGSDSLSEKKILVAVLNSASKRLLDMARDFADDLMLIVDECHRAGAPTFARVLQTPAAFRLGLSATPDREELDDDGEPLEYDEQLVGRALGAVVFRFGLREARLAGWLPEFTVHHHGVELERDERDEYERLTRQVDDLADRLRDLGGEATRARQLMSRPGDLGQLAGAYVALTAKRKDLLYRARERSRVTERIVREVRARRPTARVLLFHERIEEAAELRDRLDPVVETGIEHSRLATGLRRQVLDRFRDGSLDVLVSVKSLIEGIDVPSADVGVSVASSASVRQRIQSLGRVLRRTFDATDKTAEMHVIYVAESVDEVIYTKEDWADLTGDAANRYWRWPANPDEEPFEQHGPPRAPRPTEEQEWERLGGAPTSPVPWLGAQPDREYSVDTTGTVRNASGGLIMNAQGVAGIVEAVRGRPGGRFFVTPAHHLVVVREAAPDGRLMVAGYLDEPFAVRAEVDAAVAFDATSLNPGMAYGGRLDKDHGEFRLLRKRGGVIQRDLPGGIKEFALTSDAEARGVDNAQHLLAAWRAVGGVGLKFCVNSLWHAWYVDGGEPRFLAEVSGGFAWPSDSEESD